MHEQQAWTYSGCLRSAKRSIATESSYFVTFPSSARNSQAGGRGKDARTCLGAIGLRWVTAPQRPLRGTGTNSRLKLALTSSPLFSNAKTVSVYPCCETTCSNSNTVLCLAPGCLVIMRKKIHPTQVLLWTGKSPPPLLPRCQNKRGNSASYGQV